MLRHRLISGIFIGCTVLVLANYLPTLGTWVVLVFLSSVAQLEFYGLMNRAGIQVFRVYGTMCGAALISATFCTAGPLPADLAAGYRWENVVLLATLLIVLVRQFPQKNNKQPIATISCTLLGIWYVPFLFNYLTRLAFGWSAAASSAEVSVTGRLLIIYLLAVVKLSDVGAYFTGRAFGRHKLCGRISPGKTWEGLLGGIAFALITSVLFSIITEGSLGVVELSLEHGLVLGVLLPVTGVVGDIFESLIKRAAGVKDSSSVIPGMGGILDVLDSLLFAAPVLYVYARFLL